MPIAADSLSLIGTVVAGILTVIVLSFAIKDNAVFRLALYLLIGVSAGYAGAIAIEDVIFPELLLPIIELLSANPEINLVDLAMRTVLTILLLTKLFPRIAPIGNPATALLVGVGAALAIAGAVQGSILPQIGAAGNSFDTDSLRLALLGGYYVEGTGLLIQGGITLLATVGTLAYFHFGTNASDSESAKRPAIMEWLAWIGRVFIPITLASLFAAVLLATLTAFIERIDFLLNLLRSFTAN